MARHFTKQEIEEIRRQLATYGVRDSEFPEATTVSSEDEVMILQDEKNKRLDVGKIENKIYTKIHDEGIDGKVLSDNNYTKGEKNKLAGIASGAQVNVIEKIKQDGVLRPIASDKSVNIDLSDFVHKNLVSPDATPSNRLADKKYVHDQIVISAATFRGTSPKDLTEEQFIAWANTREHDLNDYVYWDTIDANEIPIYKRYKWDNHEWVFEYVVNNSDFSDAQLAAINSGIDTTHVDKLDALPTRSGLTAEFAEKQDVIEDLEEIRQNAETGGNAYHLPVTGIPSTDLSEGVNSSLAKAESAIQDVSDKISSDDIDDVIELTQEEFDALVTKDPRTLYIVSDSTIESDHVGIASLVQTTVATTDEGINVWTCTLTNNQTFTLNVKNGSKGTSGYSGAAEDLEVVNSLDSTDDTAALAASQGKVLDEKITQLGQELGQYTHVSFEEYVGWMLDNNGTYASADRNSFSVIPVVAGASYKIIKGANNVHIAFLNSFNGIPAESFDINGTRLVITSSTPVTGTVPNGANYIYILRKYSGSYWALPTIEIDGVNIINPLDIQIMESKKNTDSSMSAISGRVSILESGISERIKYSDIHTIVASNNLANPEDIAKGWINSDYEFVPLPNNAWRTLVFNCTGYRGATLTFGGSTIPDEARYAFYAGDVLSEHVNKGNYTIPATVIVPDAADVLYITIARYSDAEYAQFRLNVGETLAPYDDYCEKVDKLVGMELYASGSAPQEQDAGFRPLSLKINKRLSPINFQIDWGGEQSTANDKLIADLFEYYGLRCGFALGTTNILLQSTIDQYLELQQKGHSILNHAGSTPFTTTNFPTAVDAYNHIMGYQKTLLKQGFVPNGFVAAASQYDSSLIDAVQSVFAYGATYGDSPYNTRESNPCCIGRQSMENTTRAYIYKSIKTAITLERIIPLYGHSYNFGVTGKSINVTATILAVNSGSIRVSCNQPLNAGTYNITLTRTSGSGDEQIAVTGVALGDDYTNTLAVTGIITAPAVNDTYSCVVSDEWNLDKLRDIIEHCLLVEKQFGCRIMSPDDAYRYFFNL